MAAEFSNEWDKGAVDGACAKLNGGYIKLYTTARPASVATAITDQTLIVTLTMNNPAFSAATGTPPTAAFSGTVSAIADAAGTPTWGRAFTSGDVALWDGDVTAVGGGGEIQISNTSPDAGQIINLLTCTYSQS